MIFRRLTKRERIIFSLTVCVALGFLLYRGVIKPLQEQIVKIDNNIETQKKRLVKNYKTVDEAKTLEAGYNEVIASFKQTKPNEQVMASILAEIEQVAGDLKLQISDLKPQRVQTLDYFNRFSVSLTIESPFVDIIHFLHILQLEPHLFNVDQVRFDKGTRRMSDVRKIQLILSKILVPSS